MCMLMTKMLVELSSARGESGASTRLREPEIGPKVERLILVNLYLSELQGLQSSECSIVGSEQTSAASVTCTGLAGVW